MDSKVLQILHKDHIHQSELLDLIEEELERFDAVPSVPNFELIVLALEYCTDYPGNYHHPAEDAVYARLIASTPELKDQLVSIHKDHETLARMTEAFSLEISKVIEGGAPQTAQDLGNLFVRHYRRHMDVEETEIFPAARKYLGADDWRAIEAEIELPGDPLFDEHVRSAYQALQQRIVRRRKEISC